MEGFCLSIISGMNQSDAYREHYNCEKMKPESIHRKAKELMDNGKVTARLEELREPVRKAACLDLESHLRRLNDLSMVAEAEGQFGPAITAETNRGKAAGLYIEKIEQSGPNGGAIENKWIVEIVEPKVK
jgi:hypothetical protein